MIHEIGRALAKQVSVQESTALLHDHPTPTEIWTYRAEELAGQITPGVGSHPDLYTQIVRFDTRLKKNEV